MIFFNSSLIFVQTDKPKAICPSNFFKVGGIIRPKLYLVAMILENSTIHILILFDLILYVPSTIFQLNRDGSSWVEPVLS